MLSRLVPDTRTQPCSTNDDVPILGIQLNGLVTQADLKEDSRHDPLLQQVAVFTQSQWPKQVPLNLRGFQRHRDELTVWGDCCIARGTRAVIPDTLQERVLHMAHDGHPGIVRMKQRCREAVWWPNLNKDIESFVQHCEACAGSGKSSKLPPPPLQPIPWPMQPWEYIAIDIFGGVSATKVLWVEDDQNAIVKVPIRSLVTCDLDLLAPRRVTYALLQDEGG